MPPKKQPPKQAPKQAPKQVSKQPPKPPPKQPPQQQSWITRTTSAAAAGVGNFAGAIVTAAGNGVAGAGKGAGSRYVCTSQRAMKLIADSVTNTSRGWGDTIREYG